MTQIQLQDAIENIYTSLNNENEDIDLHIENLKTALKGEKSVVFATDRLAQNNRQGRKMMQSYFKKRGITVNFEDKKS